VERLPDPVVQPGVDLIPRPGHRSRTRASLRLDHQDRRVGTSCIPCGLAQPVPGNLHAHGEDRRLRHYSSTGTTVAATPATSSPSSSCTRAVLAQRSVRGGRGTGQGREAAQLQPRLGDSPQWLQWQERPDGKGPDKPTTGPTSGGEHEGKPVWQTSFVFAGVPMQLPVTFRRRTPRLRATSASTRRSTTRASSACTCPANVADLKNAMDQRNYKSTEFYHTLLMSNHNESTRCNFRRRHPGQGAVAINEYRMQGMYDVSRVAGRASSATRCSLRRSRRRTPRHRSTTTPATGATCAMAAASPSTPKASSTFAPRVG
jgi:hypothetical protein